MTDEAPAPPQKTSALGQALVAAGAGTPLAMLSVMLYQDAFHRVLSTNEALAVGTCGAAVLGYLWHVFQVGLNRLIIRGNP